MWNKYSYSSAVSIHTELDMWCKHQDVWVYKSSSMVIVFSGHVLCKEPHGRSLI